MGLLVSLIGYLTCICRFMDWQRTTVLPLQEMLGQVCHSAPAIIIIVYLRICLAIILPCSPAALLGLCSM